MKKFISLTVVLLFLSVNASADSFDSDYCSTFANDLHLSLQQRAFDEGLLDDLLSMHIHDAAVEIEEMCRESGALSIGEFNRAVSEILRSHGISI